MKNYILYNILKFINMNILPYSFRKTVVKNDNTRKLVKFLKRINEYPNFRNGLSTDPTHLLAFNILLFMSPTKLFKEDFRFLTPKLNNRLNIQLWWEHYCHAYDVKKYNLPWGLIIKIKLEDVREKLLKNEEN